jgi:uncharacterized membrane protein
MSDLIVMTFENETDASEALASLRSVEHAAALRIDDSAVIVKAADGGVSVKNEVDSATKTGAVAGGALGLLAFFVFPIAGIAAGAAGGAVVGHLLDRRVDADFVRDVSASLAPGTSALFVLVRDEQPAALVGALGKFRGKVYQTTLDPEFEAEIDAALARGASGT